MDQKKELVKNFIVDNFLFGDEEKLKDDTDFFSSGIIDSTGIIELVGFIETSFPVKVEDEELVVNNFSSLNSVSAYLDRKLNSNS
ncbi:MAG: acyl carrier protein [Ignavibacterium sp.]|nr:acyl carrier protein [Ignavibacterium sp.]